MGNASKPLSWYCKHITDEQIPRADPEMTFISSLNGYYIDTAADKYNKTVYLTFDAGYENGNIEKVLDVLKEKNVEGSFFILENLVKRNPELVKRMADEGHLVCNHTASHKDITSFTSRDSLDAELKKLENSALHCAGVEVAKFFRPPEGRFSRQSLEWANELGYKTVFWSFAYADWDNNDQMDPDAAYNKIVDGMHPGEILLLHPTSETNRVILPDLIDTFRAKGYEFKTLDNLC
ncbi:MAG: polysaccharide deacetylase family protein [Clostridia bacterium]|nr:polysaccharide deacetylase family protein [Clostridia bacterium]